MNLSKKREHVESLDDLNQLEYNLTLSLISIIIYTIENLIETFASAFEWSAIKTNNQTDRYI